MIAAATPADTAGREAIASWIGSAIAATRSTSSPSRNTGEPCRDLRGDIDVVAGESQNDVARGVLVAGKGVRQRETHDRRGIVEEDGHRGVHAFLDLRACFAMEVGPGKGMGGVGAPTHRRGVKPVQKLVHAHRLAPGFE